MTWQLVAAQQKFQDHAGHWDDLNRKLFDGHPLLDSLFVGPLVKYFASNGVLLAIRSDASGATGMLLLAPARPGIMMSFFPSQTPIGPVLLASLDDTPSLFRALPRTIMALDLYGQDPDYCAAAAKHGVLATEDMHHALTLNIAMQGDFSSYWSARPRKLRQQVTGAINRVKRSGWSPRLDIVQDPLLIEQAVARYADLESQGWKGAAGTALGNGNVQGMFYKEMLNNFAKGGRAHVFELYFDSALVASQLTISNDVMLITLKTTYDESFRDFSPGDLLDYSMLEGEFQSKRFRKIEFYTNAGPELLRWGTQSRYIQHRSIYRNRLMKVIAGTVRTLRRFSTSPTKANPST